MYTGCGFGKTLGVQENNSSQNRYLKFKLFCSLSSWSGASRLVGLNNSSFEFQMRRCLRMNLILLRWCSLGLIAEQDQTRFFVV